MNQRIKNYTYQHMFEQSAREQQIRMCVFRSVLSVVDHEYDQTHQGQRLFCEGANVRPSVEHHQSIHD